MSTLIESEYEIVMWSNMMFCRVIRFACDYARQQGPSVQESLWIDKFAQWEELVSMGVTIEEAFSSVHEVDDWARICFGCAQAIYERKIGNQENQDWQIGTIWALYTLARMLGDDFRRRENVSSTSDEREPEWRKAHLKHYHRLNRKLARVLHERAQVFARLNPTFPAD